MSTPHEIFYESCKTYANLFKDMNPDETELLAAIGTMRKAIDKYKKGSRNDKFTIGILADGRSLESLRQSTHTMQDFLIAYGIESDIIINNKPKDSIRPPYNIDIVWAATSSGTTEVVYNGIEKLQQHKYRPPIILHIGNPDSHIGLQTKNMENVSRIYTPSKSKQDDVETAPEEDQNTINSMGARFEFLESMIHEGVAYAALEGKTAEESLDNFNTYKNNHAMNAEKISEVKKKKIDKLINAEKEAHETLIDMEKEEYRTESREKPVIAILADDRTGIISGFHGNRQIQALFNHYTGKDTSILEKIGDNGVLVSYSNTDKFKNVLSIAESMGYDAFSIIPSCLYEDTAYKDNQIIVPGIEPSDEFGIYKKPIRTSMIQSNYKVLMESANNELFKHLGITEGFLKNHHKNDALGGIKNQEIPQLIPKRI